MSGAGGMAVSKRLLASFISFTSLWGVIMDIVDRLWLISLVFIFNCYFPSKEQNLYISAMQCSVWTNSAPSHVRKREGLERTCLVGFAPSLLHFFCPLSSTYVMSWQSVLATIGIWTEERLQRFFFNFSNHIKVKLEMCGFPEKFDRVSMPNANPQ